VVRPEQVLRASEVLGRDEICLRCRLFLAQMQIAHVSPWEHGYKKAGSASGPPQRGILLRTWAGLL
jgi:hypothetical protein